MILGQTWKCDAVLCSALMENRALLERTEKRSKKETAGNHGTLGLEEESGSRDLWTWNYSVGKPLHCPELLLSSGLTIGLRITCSRLLNELLILFPQSTSRPYLPAHLLRTGEASVIINPVMRGSRFFTKHFAPDLAEKRRSVDVSGMNGVGVGLGKMKMIILKKLEPNWRLQTCILAV